MSILVKNKHTLQIDEFKFKCCIGKNGTTSTKKEGDKKHQKEPLKFNIFILGKIVKKNHPLYLNVLKLKKIWVGVMTFVFLKNIINFAK